MYHCHPPDNDHNCANDSNEYVNPYKEQHIPYKD